MPAVSHRYFVRTPDGGSISGYHQSALAEAVALNIGEGACLIDTAAPPYVPMAQQVVGGELQFMAVGGWGAELQSLEYNFIQAIKRKHIPFIHAYLAKGADPNSRDEMGRPAIIWAVATGSAEIVGFLLSHGADPGAADRSGTTATSLAAERQASEILTLLNQAL